MAKTEVNIRQGGGMTAALLILSAIFFIAAVVFYDRYKNAKEDVKTLEQTKAALLDSNAFYVTKSGQEAVKTHALSLKVSELTGENAWLKKEAKNAKIKQGNVVSGIAITAASIIDTAIAIRDSTQMIPVVKKERIFEYNDGWNTIHGVIHSDTVTIRQQSVDSLYILDNIEPKRFFFIKYGVKNEWFTVTNKNPKIKISGIKVIKIMHKK